MMVDAEERHQYMTWRRDRARRITTAKQKIQQLYTSEVVAWNRGSITIDRFSTPNVTN